MISGRFFIMRTFWIQTLGCRVNQFESEQIATLLRGRGLVQVDSSQADLRIVNTCSVTLQAASKSRQTIRRTTRLPVLRSGEGEAPAEPCEPVNSRSAGASPSQMKTIVTGCWATSDKSEAQGLPGVDAVLTHHDDVAAELERLLDQWDKPNCRAPEPIRDDEFMNEAGTPATYVTHDHNQPLPVPVKQNFSKSRGTTRLPLLGEHQTGRQRAYLKIQDGCDAHCTYCIIPQLRGSLWSKPIDDAVEEARRLVDSGHREIVLTGIFLGAYGRSTALRRRQDACADLPLAGLVNALCTQVPALRRLRFSSLEPGDLTPELIASLNSYPQVVPHFHLPLQSGSSAILHRMNRQYSPDDFLRMIDQVNSAFDRPAITTDIIVGFPGESDAQFEQTLDLVERVKFIHIHAFSFSPRPGTAAARWTGQFVRGPVVNRRIELLKARANVHSLAFRQRFLGETVEVLVEQSDSRSPIRHGRCERYFDVLFDNQHSVPGDLVRLEIERVTPTGTWGRAI